MDKNRTIKILLIEDEEFDVRRVENTIAPFSRRIIISEVVSDGKSAIELLEKKKNEFDIVIMDYQIAGGIRGEYLIKKIKDTDPSIQIIVITKMTINLTDYEFAQSLITAGAFWYCTKYPVDIEEYIYQPTDFVLSIFNAYEKKELLRERINSKAKIKRNVEGILTSKQIIGVSDQIVKLREQIKKIADSNAPVLITGESGTGKELVAYNIHYNSVRKYENFVPINCGGIPEQLIESELFGYEKGAFTGADKAKPGLFEVGDKGTIFLDEIPELPLTSQVKLLRVLQDGEVEKLGRLDKIKVDVRILSATNKNLDEEVKAGRFREDLFYRLNVLPIYIPPLRERKEDIIYLTDYFLNHYALDIGKPMPALTEEAMSMLVEYDWPGNVRELKNLVQRLLFYGENIITPEQIASAIGKSTSSSGGFSRDDGISFKSGNGYPTLKEMEKQLRLKYFQYIRSKTNSDAEAAKILGLAPPNYYRMCKELGLK
ncbi:two component, sigma54 specific, transcriptional regulator, Fis family [Melioribacter roseus P3M-2]|uniref:Two component, sigma54 specific, transcriptional regulator, Fis family n=1 Tax=Melioribacter roseus (strain DSM 23840 / JCM 17771 / VKM B-2668 / P3M-2) TaxID=1191523 RepID=I6ZYH0_MELRP|nr:sigma-54 dependent transcriptional regulator [Melioribacter roseus]AFN74073.1 two component, sigma54 specific, transcriptional regulator, Fis family [Melioribacter roseus P3M-2]